MAPICTRSLIPELELLRLLTFISDLIGTTTVPNRKKREWVRPWLKRTILNDHLQTTVSSAQWSRAGQLIVHRKTEINARSYDILKYYECRNKLQYFSITISFNTKLFS